jgi:hypothetical protein
MRSLDDMMKQAKEANRAAPPKERDWYQRVKVPDDPKLVGKGDWSGSSWSGERWSGRNQSGGRER